MKALTNAGLALVLFAGPLPAASGPAPGAGHVKERVRAWRQAHEIDVLREFAALLAIPNLASDEVNIRSNAARIQALLEKRGVKVRLLETPGSPPAVFGEYRVPGARRTILIYAHYDGQPVDPAAWSGDPWTPMLRAGRLEDGAREIPLGSLGGPTHGEWRLYGRSASDDKAPIIGFLAALDALQSAGIAPSVNLKFLFEGEEEAGSPHVKALLEAHAELLRSDAFILCDGPVHQSRRMQLYFGARGTTDLEITVYGASRTLHSGHYGNWAPNPAARLSHLLAGLRDPEGRILVAGYYDDVRPPTDGERRALAEVPDADAALRGELALPVTEAGNARLVERLLLPALNLRGLESGRVGAAAANAIPTVARASIDFRLVPDQTPQRIRERVEAHLKAQGWSVVHEAPDLEARRAHAKLVLLEWGAGYPAARTSLDLPASRAVSKVVEEATGAPLVRVPTLGGSVPMYLFEQVLKTPVIGVPIANHDNNQHAANENIRLQNLWDGIEVYAALLARLGPALEETR